MSLRGAGWVRLCALKGEALQHSGRVDRLSSRRYCVCDQGPCGRRILVVQVVEAPAHVCASGTLEGSSKSLSRKLLTSGWTARLSEQQLRLARVREIRRPCQGDSIPAAVGLRSPRGVRCDVRVGYRAIACAHCLELTHG